MATGLAHLEFSLPVLIVLASAPFWGHMTWRGGLGTSFVALASGAIPFARDNATMPYGFAVGAALLCVAAAFWIAEARHARRRGDEERKNRAEDKHRENMRDFGR